MKERNLQLIKLQMSLKADGIEPQPTLRMRNELGFPSPLILGFYSQKVSWEKTQKRNRQQQVLLHRVLEQKQYLEQIREAEQAIGKFGVYIDVYMFFYVYICSGIKKYSRVSGSVRILPDTHGSLKTKPVRVLSWNRSKTGSGISVWVRFGSLDSGIMPRARF